LWAGVPVFGFVDRGTDDGRCAEGWIERMFRGAAYFLG